MTAPYNNVPMTDRGRHRVANNEAFWNGPRLIVLSFVVLGAAFALLWASAEGVIGPSFNEATWGSESHFLQGDAVEPRRID